MFKAHLRIFSKKRVRNVPRNQNRGDEEAARKSWKSERDNHTGRTLKKAWNVLAMCLLTHRHNKKNKLKCHTNKGTVTNNLISGVNNKATPAFQTKNNVPLP